MSNSTIPGPCNPYLPIDPPPQKNPEPSYAIPTRDSIISLQPITGSNLKSICELKISSAQEYLICNNAYSIAQSFYEEDSVWQRGIYADDVPVGYLQYSQTPETGEYYLWRVMIDQRYQGMGFAKRSITMSLDHIISDATACGVAPVMLWLGVNPNNLGAIKCYESIGFRATGKWEHPDEIQMVYDIKKLNIDGI